MGFNYGASPYTLSNFTEIFKVCFLYSAYMSFVSDLCLVSVFSLVVVCVFTNEVSSEKHMVYIFRYDTL